MQYRFTIGPTGRLVDISDLTRETRHDLGPYRCLDYGDEMEPALGMKNVHHFRHRHVRNVECSRETYLHEAAKLAVAEGFGDAVAEGIPYILDKERPRICRRFEVKFGHVCDLDPVRERFDLTRHLQVAHVEKGIGGFVADLLLEGTDGSNRVLVEIEVTHSCDPRKIASGLKIIETRVESEDDIAQLRSGFRIDGDKTRGYNLTDLAVREIKDCKGCKATVSAFIVYLSCKVRIARMSLEEAGRMSRQDNICSATIRT